MLPWLNEKPSAEAGQYQCHLIFFILFLLPLGIVVVLPVFLAAAARVWWERSGTPATRRREELQGPQLRPDRGVEGVRIRILSLVGTGTENGVRSGGNAMEETKTAREEKIREEKMILARSLEHLHGPEEIPYGEDELVVVCLVRDGRPYVKSFVEHYFALGAKYIAFLDNNSTDGTVEALREYNNVTVLRTKLPYKANTGITRDGITGNGWSREILFKQYLISRFGKQDRWCLCVDIDELFDYPYSDVVSLRSLLNYLSSKSYTAV